MLIGGPLCLLVNGGGFKRVMAELGVGRAEGGGELYIVSPQHDTQEQGWYRNYLPPALTRHADSRGPRGAR